MPIRSELPQKQTQLCSGVRRSFFCRMKTGLRKDSLEMGNVKTKREQDIDSHPRRKKPGTTYYQNTLTSSSCTFHKCFNVTYDASSCKNRSFKQFLADSRQYSLIHCSGYIKSWSQAKMGIEDDNESDGDGSNLSCLVIVGMPQVCIRMYSWIKPIHFEYTLGNRNTNLINPQYCK